MPILHHYTEAGKYVWDLKPFKNGAFADGRARRFVVFPSPITVA
jgi:hypothetical protein